MKISEPAIIFLGTSEFAVPFLQVLVGRGFKPVLVVTQPDEPSGRSQKLQSPPVKIQADILKLKVAQPRNSEELKKVFNNNPADICVLVAYGRIIPAEILNKIKLGFINVHPSLLPKYRGSSPVQSAIFNGDKETGITIMLLDPKTDHGPILAEQKVAILPNDNNQTLHQRLADNGTDFLIQTLQKYLSGEITTRPQDHSRAIYTKIIKRADGRLDWSRSADDLERQFRAFYPWPGVFTYWGNKRLKIGKMKVLDGVLSQSLVPGQVFLVNNTLAIKCGQGAIIFDTIQLEGKNEMTASEFLRGYKNIENETLS